MKGVKTLNQANRALHERTPDKAFLNEMIKAGHLEVEEFCTL